MSDSIQEIALHFASTRCFKVARNISQDLIIHPGMTHYSIIAYYVSQNKISTQIIICINIENKVISQVLNRIIKQYEDHP